MCDPYRTGAHDPSDADAPGATLDVKGQEFTLTKARIDASIALSYRGAASGGGGSGFSMEIAARGSVSWPCYSFMQFAGSLELSFGPAVDFGKLHLSLDVQCQDPEAYASESVYIIEVFEDPDKMHSEVAVGDTSTTYGKLTSTTYGSTYDDYAVFANAPNDYEDEAEEEVVRSCLVNKNSTTISSRNGDTINFVEDNFWGASKVKVGPGTHCSPRHRHAF